MDIYRHKESFEAWKKDVLNSKENINQKYIEKGLTKENTKLFVKYILDMEEGINVSGVRGPRSPKTLNRLRSKISSIMKLFQENSLNDITKVKPEQVNKIFNKWVDKGHTTDYAVRFRTFWGWWMKVNRKEGKTILDVCMDLDTRGKTESTFVWLTKEEFDKLRKYFDEQKQLILIFVFDSLVRSPSELMGLKCEDVSQNSKGEVWINIPNEISKTFGRRFNLVYCGEQLLKHIKDKKPQDPIFEFSYPMLNKELQKVAEQVFGDNKNGGGDYYKKITLYDLRHSGAIHFRQLFQATGQSLDALRHRGGWSDLRMINYYTKMLGLSGHIDKEKTLLQEDKTELEKQGTEQQEEIEKLKEEMKKIKENLGDPEMLKKFNQIPEELIKDRVRKEIEELIKEGVLSNEILSRQSF